MALLTLAFALIGSLPSPHDATARRNVVVVVTDGLRADEVFSGAERALMSRTGGVENEAGLLEKYWRNSLEARRAALMPFMWETIAQRGQLFSRAHVTNTKRLSYPGYNELFTGSADPRIESNEHSENPNVTVFEWLARQPEFDGQVQAFATWETFFRIFATSRSGLDVRAGMNPPFEREQRRTPARDAIDELYRSATPMFGGNALDAYVALTLKESLRTRHPRVLFVGLGETDEWMHAGRYDLALEAAHRADRFIGELWATLQSMPEYKDQTTLLITTDHGRGHGLSEWRDHGAEIDGADDIWFAALGAGVPALGVRSELEVRQGQLAATIASLLGFDWSTAAPNAERPLPLQPRVHAEHAKPSRLEVRGLESVASPGALGLR